MGFDTLYGRCINDTWLGMGVSKVRLEEVLEVCVVLLIRLKGGLEGLEGVFGWVVSGLILGMRGKLSVLSENI